MDKMEYMVVWNTEDCIDGIPVETFYDAKETALVILNEWARDGLTIIDENDFSDEIRDGWNQMIENCWVEVRKYNPETKEYEKFWSPSEEDLESIGAFGWFPITTLREIYKEFSDFSDDDVSEDDSQPNC